MPVGERERERSQNSELYYTRIKILGSCLILQSVPANLNASRLHIKLRNNTDYRSNEKDDNKRERERQFFLCVCVCSSFLIPLRKPVTIIKNKTACIRRCRGKLMEFYDWL